MLSNFEQISYEYCELIKFGVLEQNVIGRIFVNDEKLKSLYFSLSEYLRYKDIYNYTSRYINSCIAFKSLYSSEYYKDSCNVPSNLKNSIKLVNFNVWQPSVLMHKYALIYNKYFNLPDVLLLTLSSYLDSIYNKYIMNNSLYNDSIILLTKTGFGIIINNIGTIHNFRYKEILLQPIFNNTKELIEGEDVW